MQNLKLIVGFLLVIIITIVLDPISVSGRCQYEDSSTPSINGVVTEKELSLLPRTTLIVEDGLRRNDGCRGSSCNTLNDPCCSGCYCIPIGLLWVGWCEGNCC
ncbi:hypothetical protein FNV43_RR10391 [Rhamnella rubrinervis]|uniref:Uncharacterized protein n=1 Tax=Rhamnella rubrinervis TaxID=2594499 RepID=A0A8K0MLA1_9ROSA|nr:hypothetical protein FNV43_RR10391 [Rhamnella rubrinervis]